MKPAQITMLTDVPGLQPDAFAPVPTTEDASAWPVWWSFSADNAPHIPCSDTLPTRDEQTSGTPIGSTGTTRRTNTSPLCGRGTRFSSQAVRTLKSWFDAHLAHPYPSVGDLDTLQTQTGLSRLQLTTWFANHRRHSKSGRGRFQRPPSPAPQFVTRQSVPSRHLPRDADGMDPLERWRNSPPEDEGADSYDISRAIRASLQEPTMPSRQQPRESRYASSASSAGTSDSNRSTDSVCSNSSGHSGISGFSSSRTGRAKRRRRGSRRTVEDQILKATAPKSARGARASTFLLSAPRLFQCTFCTQTFKTRHNWQRHEKSFHLSLEAWECSPGGATSFDTDARVACAYCGITEPDEAHLASHNYESCALRSAPERTFFRKDHLAQHLRLVHHAHYIPEIMQQWKFELQMIRSRCGFCDYTSHLWSDRMDHLADHFKKGQTMAEWEGDWGFDPEVLEMVENSMPPYLIEFERNTPLPFQAGHPPPFGPSAAYDLLCVELEDFFLIYTESRNCSPSVPEMQYEACKIIFASQILWNQTHRPESWLYDLLTSSETISSAAKNCPIKSVAKFRSTELRIHGKHNIFEGCTMETALRDRVVKTMALFDQVIEDQWLQEHTKELVREADRRSQLSTGSFANFLVSLIDQSTTWLEAFRSRAGIPTQPDNMSTVEQGKACNVPWPQSTIAIPAAIVPSPQDDNPSKATMPALIGVSASDAFRHESITTNNNHGFLDHSNYYRNLIHKLSRFVAMSTSLNNPSRHIPTDEELQRQARWIMYDDDDPWNQTPADVPHWLRDFKRSVGLDFEERTFALTGSN